MLLEFTPLYWFGIFVGLILGYYLVDWWYKNNKEYLLKCTKVTTIHKIYRFESNTLLAIVSMVMTIFLIMYLVLFIYR